MRNNFFISETVEMLKYHKILEKVNSSIFISRCSFKNNSTFFYFFFSFNSFMTEAVII